MKYRKLIFYFLLLVVGAIKQHKNIRRLPATHNDDIMISRSTEALQPADPLLIITEVGYYLDCSLLCVKYPFCVSSSYILVAKLCLLSESTLKTHEIRSWDRRLLPSIYTELEDDNVFADRSATVLPIWVTPFMCGTSVFPSNRIRRKRIIGGWTAEPYQAPWIGVLMKNGRIRCTAFLVSRRPTHRSSIWVLSAKHCFHDAISEDDPSSKINLKPFSFLFGIHDTRVRTQHFIYRSANGIFFPSEDGLKPKDVALIRLNKPVKFDGYINGLCLPNVLEEYRTLPFTPCITCGFGATKLETKPAFGSNILKCIEIDTQGSDWDDNAYSDGNSVIKLKASAFGPYHGDSGSPIFCDSGRLWSFLFAIVTGGQQSVYKTAYLMAAKISYFMDFIDQHMNEDLCCQS